MIILLLCFAVFCGFVAASVGSKKDAALSGFGMGLFFGPLGIIIACLLDQRPKCPSCKEHTDSEASICRCCRTELIPASVLRQQNLASLGPSITRHKKAGEDLPAIGSALSGWHKGVFQSAPDESGMPAQSRDKPKLPPRRPYPPK